MAKARELIRRSDAKSKERARSLRPSEEKSSDGLAFFSVPSQHTPGKRYIVTLSAPSIRDDSTEQDLRSVLNSEDVKVSCSCDAFLYRGYKFIAYKAGAGIEPGGRVPVHTNPRQDGMLCKHIIAVLHKLGQ